MRSVLPNLTCTTPVVRLTRSIEFNVPTLAIRVGHLPTSTVRDATIAAAIRNQAPRGSGPESRTFDKRVSLETP